LRTIQGAGKLAFGRSFSARSIAGKGAWDEKEDFLSDFPRVNHGTTKRLSSEDIGFRDVELNVTIFIHRTHEDE
jgi:hypothetical protein